MKKMGKKKKRRNNKRIDSLEINKRILRDFLDMESGAENNMELFGGFWPLIEKKGLNIRDKIKIPQLDFSKIISNEQPSGTKIMQYKNGMITVSKFKVGQTAKLKCLNNLRAENDKLMYQLEDEFLKEFAGAEVFIQRILGERQLRKDAEPKMWYEVGKFGRNIMYIPEDFLEEIPEPRKEPEENLQENGVAEETEKERLEKFEAVLNELGPYDKMAVGDHNLYPFRISNLFKECFMKDISDSDRIEGLLHITSIARTAYQHYEEVTLSMYGISQIQLETYRKKNADYGNSFDESMDEDGILVSKIRIGDKIRRIQSLTKKGGEGQVKDERLEDTYLDLANYCVMTILWIRKQQSK